MNQAQNMPRGQSFSTPSHTRRWYRISNHIKGQTLITATPEYGYTGTLSSELVDFARRQLVNATLYKGDEQRREGRHPMMLPVLVVPVDDNNQPIGETFEVIARDVSSTSIGLVHTDEIHFERLAIHLLLASTEVNLVIQMRWKGPMGPFYGSAGTYEEKLSEFPGEVPAQPQR